MTYFPGVGAFEQLFGSGGNLNTNFPKIQMPEVGMLKFRLLTAGTLRLTPSCSYL